MYAIEASNLSKKYGEKVVVNNLNLKVKEGSVFGFLGKNGAGKSTFINMITGLISPTSGSFKLFGATQYSDKDFYTKIGVLPDYSTFYEHLTALEHLKYFSGILGLSMTKEGMMDILRLVELEDSANLKAGKFSFGMKKRLGIAQALMNNPRILFLDEPTSGVDANAALNIHSLIENISKKGTTIFLTSHNLDEVEKLCDDIAIMDKGNIKIQGSMEELRNEYTNNITLYIKHGEVPEEQRELIKKNLLTLAKSVRVGSNNTELLIDHEETINSINRLFLSQEINVYRLEIDEPSLEEIFISMNMDSI
ncbi:ABC transporter ATP-binding protein (plasmid) [Priestia megaterium]|uniref:ABC transporter ATP-binding protein n=1 Tax=Priestia megaterium TaxID=1404 RepID=UPI001EDA752B|nr:ABC transporter ATP-binding protein [Priestia megaterium]UKJ83499.1 ABC transporter ATP-binding protein [Priestia megaterium]